MTRPGARRSPRRIVVDVREEAGVWVGRSTDGDGEWTYRSSQSPEDARKRAWRRAVQGVRDVLVVPYDLGYGVDPTWEPPRRSKPSAEVALCAAVLLRALDDLELGMVDDVLRWTRGEGEGLAFGTICEALGLDPDAVRRVIDGRASKQKQGQPARAAGRPNPARRGRGRRESPSEWIGRR